MKILGRIGKGLLALLLLAWLGLGAYAYWPTGIEEVPASELAGANDRFVTVDGLSLRYRTWGEPAPDRPTALLIHGFGNSLQSFRLLAPELADTFYVVAVDMPGFGLSAKPADRDYHNPAQAEIMGDFMRALGLKRVVVGGHSLGGAIALRVALNEPEVVGLVLMNPGIINTGVPKIAEYYFWPLQRLSAKQFGNRDFRETFLKRSFVKPEIVTPEVMDDLMLTVRSEGYMAGMTAMMGQYEAATEAAMLPQVKVPTLIAWGDQDRGKSLNELEQLRAGLPDSMVARMPDAGHYVHEEAPADVAAAMNAARDRWL
jgi:pimeloyl-ACP methyl ester carboxylesterase